jgi:hypothetical protein
MPGLGKKTFTAGDVLIAGDVNGYLMDQTVMNFATVAARSSAIPVPSEGMVSYRQDAKNIEFYNGTSWVANKSASGSYTANGTLTTAYATYITISLTTTTRPLYVFFSATGNNGNSGAQQTFSVRAQIDGVNIGSEIDGIRAMLVSGQGSLHTTSHAFLLTPTAGVKSFTLQLKASANGSVTLPYAQFVVYEI